MISLFPEATETDMETAKVQKVRVEIVLPSELIGFLTAFSPGLAAAFSHVAAGCLLPYA